MVLVAYILDIYISILQTKFSHRERYEARCVGLETMPLDQHIEDGHGEREPRLKIRPLKVGGIAFRGMEGSITQDNHTPIKLLNQPLKGVIRDVRGGTRPSHDQSPLIQ